MAAPSNEEMEERVSALIGQDVVLARELIQAQVAESKIADELREAQVVVRKAKEEAKGVKPDGLFQGYHIAVSQAKDHVDEVKGRRSAQKAVVQGVRHRMRENKAALKVARLELEERNKQAKQQGVKRGREDKEAPSQTTKKTRAGAKKEVE